MNLLGILLKALLSEGALRALAKKTGLNSKQLKKVLPLAVPLLLKMLTKNASDKDGALSLLGALGQHTSKKSLPAQIEEADQVDGGKIIGHILGANQNASVQTLANQTGLSNQAVTTALGSLAPALLSSLSSAANTAHGKVDLSDGLDLSDLAALLGGGKVSSNPLSLFGGLMNGGQSRKDAKNNSLNGNDLLSSLMSFMG